MDMSDYPWGVASEREREERGTGIGVREEERKRVRSGGGNMPGCVEGRWKEANLHGDEGKGGEEGLRKW